MDSHHLDELTKSLATTTSWRQTLKAIFAGVVGGAFVLSAMNGASAQSLREKQAALKARTQSSRRNNMPDEQSQDCAQINEPCTTNSDCCMNWCFEGLCT